MGTELLSKIHGEQVSGSGTGALAGKRVLIVLPTLELGGAERLALHLAEYLTQTEKAQVHVWGLMKYGDKPGGRVAEMCDLRGLPWRNLNFAWPGGRLATFKRSFSLAQLSHDLKRFSPYVILAYTPLVNVICGLVWRWSGARLCVWNQMSSAVEEVSHRMSLWASRLTPLFLSNSEHGAEFLAKRLGVDPSRIHLVRNGVRIEHSAWEPGSLRKDLGVSEACILVCMVANLSEYKDHATLLRAWREVLDASRRKTVLLLSGRFDGTTEFLKALAYDLDLGESVRFLGPGKINEVWSILRQVDLGVFSSRAEGCPNGVLESMALGLPVAGTDIPGIREAVGPEGYEFLAPVADHVALADRMLKLIHDRDLRERIGKLNKDRIQKCFSVGRMCEDTVRIMTTHLVGRPSNRGHAGLNEKIE